MKKERMAILKMINSGKISVDEGIRLMESMKSSSSLFSKDTLYDVKDKFCDMVDDAKPVVKKYADKAMDKAKEVSEDVYTKGKAKVTEYKNKVGKKDFVEDVIIEPTTDVIDEAEIIVDDVKEETTDEN